MCSGEKTGFLVEMSLLNTVFSSFSWISFLEAMINLSSFQ